MSEAGSTRQAAAFERHRQAVAASNRAVVPFVQIRQDIDQLEGLLDVWEPA